MHISALLMVILSDLCEGQGQIGLPKAMKHQTTEVITSNGPKTITRNFMLDSKGNVWVAAYDGIFRYDGQSFTNITSQVSSARFFDVLEDKKGNFWFASVGSGVFYYDGKSFLNFTTKDGLASDQVLDIYEDRAGSIWLATGDGASRFDPSPAWRSGVLGAKGKSFTTYRMIEGLPNGKPYDNNVKSIVEDNTGKIWFGTGGNTFAFDGKKFSVVTNQGETFLNVCNMIKDSKGNIWLASGEDGLWRYDGSTFTNFSQQPTGYVYEDRKGNIWTGSQPPYNGTDRWALSRFDAQTLSDQKPAVTDVMSEYEGYENLIFGISEANDGSIWFGTLRGVYRYDGNVITALNEEN